MLNASFRTKVYVGLSGGVDSSVSVALLKKAGYDATGVFIKVWQPDFNSPSTSSGQLQAACNWREDRLDAMRVCAKLGIPFVTLDLEKEYKKEVVDYMIREYKAGRTPNPDVMCNKEVKFGAFYKWAIENGADFIATGHYAQVIKHIIYNTKHKRVDGNVSCYMLHVSADSAKDQSYFLWNLKREQLPHVLFPVGHLKKPEVRKLAKKFGLITAEKKDSQGLCFIGKIDVKEFLSHYIKPKRGKVLNERGEVIGFHDGVVFLTEGERHGFTVNKKTNNDRPYYIIAKDISKNTITVSHKNSEGKLDQGLKSGVLLRPTNWISPELLVGRKKYEARFRYRQELFPVTLRAKDLVKHRVFDKARLGRSGTLIKVIFETPQSAVPVGQSLVLYDGDVCLGGGVIHSTLPN
ncbi:MAG: tRNA 2-thiouridine(34) synthase MnmA [Candidatus Taylorbacteria bacterium RIFCSPHIGHO2_01_FULL_45_63]|uniref:tRNA-specific 2-thiouridylase MnmA n=1 Tax=Candidatus Taylorbacteria bacterium RIFCSPHIGHO2_02_FULL_45_35 TaxID=1802311 RepID=A0A1G2MPG2_9BACT|nr:MAG: tRNA 2-thiouridine(34) synthase MnmA [Candidatus Taylorbacteria bacterium RIFCSPHIGHO2_01_FULL_45_63]OHA25743.1 MAG: tRNA 2-thiouridine(34) synthase MnmA [Candidatus Taylorbacteria bacterium RIFCSPHIGHO2_02_FULL_45_35]OHA34817.1 MAG: tRNA 2-thiouridine(34) synthase MnmA [Candidatus Taylorbacteria bacterium RIFCSPLOWO2_01_FULL_45_34b]